MNTEMISDCDIIFMKIRKTNFLITEIYIFSTQI